MENYRPGEPDKLKVPRTIETTDFYDLFKILGQNSNRNYWARQGPNPDNYVIHNLLGKKLYMHSVAVICIITQAF